MAYKEFGATIAPSNVSSTGFPIAMGTHIGGGRIVNDKTTLNSKHWCLLGEGATLNDQKANAIGQIWYDTLDNKYWKLDSWASTHPVWVDVSTIFATRSYVDDAIENIPDPMIFKGSLGTGGTITSLPTASTSNTGFTYKVITAGTYAGQVAKVGDTFISDGTTWNLIPSGDEPSGTVTSITLNATSPILIDDSNAITTSGTRTFSHASTSGNKHIPSGGSADNYLKWDSDGTATWSPLALPAASTSVAGITTVGASGGAASYVHTHVKSDITDFDHSHGNITNDGAIGTTSGLMVRTTTSGVLTTLPAGSSGQFLQYDGTWATPPDTTYTLPLASSTTRGGIKIGYTATEANLPLKLDSEKGYVTLTESSITTALEYTPYDSTNPDNYTSNTGTVTNIDTGDGLSGGPITTTGTIKLTTAYGDSVNPYASKTAKYVLAAPNTSNGVPSFRELVASDIVISSIKFDDQGTGDASGITYNGSTTQTISYNTIGAAASSHTHSTYVNQTLTSGDGMDTWTATNEDLTITLGTPSTITGSSINSVTTTSHTHAISITPANIGAAPSSHTHDYNSLSNLPEIYNAMHNWVPTDNFDSLYDEPNNVWLCVDTMIYGPLNDNGGINASDNASFEYCVVQQFGDKSAGTKVQVLYITTEHVHYLTKGSIFYRMQGDDKWKRVLTYSEIEHLQTKLTEPWDSPYTISGTNSSSAGRHLIVPELNVVKAYNNPNGTTQYYKIDDYVNSLEEAIIIINDDSNVNAYTKFNITVNSSYKISGPFTPNVDFTGPMILTIWRGTILSTLRS